MGVGKVPFGGATQPHCGKVPNCKYTASMSECHRGYGEILARMKLPFKPDGGRIKPQAELP